MENLKLFKKLLFVAAFLSSTTIFCNPEAQNQELATEILLPQENAPEKALSEEKEENSSTPEPTLKRTKPKISTIGWLVRGGLTILAALVIGKTIKHLWPKPNVESTPYVERPDLSLDASVPLPAEPTPPAPKAALDSGRPNQKSCLPVPAEPKLRVKEKSISEKIVDALKIEKPSEFKELRECFGEIKLADSTEYRKIATQLIAQKEIPLEKVAYSLFMASRWENELDRAKSIAWVAQYIKNQNCNRPETFDRCEVAALTMAATSTYLTRTYKTIEITQNPAIDINETAEFTVKAASLLAPKGTLKDRATKALAAFQKSKDSFDSAKITEAIKAAKAIYEALPKVEAAEKETRKRLDKIIKAATTVHNNFVKAQAK